MTREQLTKKKTKDITLGDGSVKARKLTQGELELVHAAFKMAKNDEAEILKLSRTLIVNHLLNDDGGPMFDAPDQVADMDPEDVAAIVAGLVSSKQGNA